MRGAGLAVALLLGVMPAVRAATLEDLVRAYPDALAGIENGELVWRDGTRMPVDDGHPDKSFAEQLHHGSILDQLREPYPGGTPPHDDPGRVRNRAFFDKMYGDCHTGAVIPKMVEVVWLPKTWGQPVGITSVNGVDRQLAAISRELDDLPLPDKKFLYPIGGTYNCRDVADTGEPSMHGYGAAIDINVGQSDYWLWHGGETTLADYHNRIPPEVVAVFERHGFIWGGHWQHYDTMHFEYRPELLGFDPRAGE
jgi:hypothetical protein